MLSAFCFNQLPLFLCICRKCIQRDYAGQTKDIPDITDMTEQVRKSFLQGLKILLAKLVLCLPSMHLERTHGRHHYHGIRMYPGFPALDIQKLLSSQICAKTSFRHGVIRQLHPHLCRDHRVAAMCNVCKRSAMDDHRRMLQCLNQIGADCILQKRRHCAFRMQIPRRHRLLFRKLSIGISDNQL